MQPEPHRVAARLGFDETTIGRLAARGHLRRLALTEPQIRARLYRGHMAYLLACAGGEGGVDSRADEADGQSQRLGVYEAGSTKPQLSAGSGAQRAQKRTPTQIGGATCDKPLSL